MTRLKFYNASLDNYGFCTASEAKLLIVIIVSRAKKIDSARNVLTSSEDSEIRPRWIFVRVREEATAVTAQQFGQLGFFSRLSTGLGDGRFLGSTADEGFSRQRRGLETRDKTRPRDSRDKSAE